MPLAPKFDHPRPNLVPIGRETDEEFPDKHTDVKFQL